MRVASLITVALVLVLPTGCSGSRGQAWSGPSGGSALLFDAEPGWPLASQMAVRSSWPATLSWQTEGEEVWYRERIVDVQADGWGVGRSHDRVHRRFETYRVGRASR